MGFSHLISNSSIFNFFSYIYAPGRRVYSSPIGWSELAYFLLLLLPLLMTLSGASGASRSVTEKLNPVIQSPVAGMELRGSTVTCEPIYGFLPCTTVGWGQLFLIAVYEFLLSLGEQYISAGSDLFFLMFGTGIFGASLFHILGSFPQVLMVLVTGLYGSTDTAESMATLGVSMLAGSAVMNLTLIWGSCVVFGNYDISDSSTPSPLENNEKPFSLTGYGVSTDDATSYTARIMILSMIPFLILQIAKLMNSSSGIRLVILISLLVTLIFLFLYCFYQAFQPWIQERRLAYLTKKFAKKNRVTSLLTATGNPNESRIREVFHEIGLDNNANISAAALRALLLGIKLEEAGLRNEDFVGKVMEDFDASRDGQIDETEFHRGITKWLYDANQPNHDEYDERPNFFSRTAKSEAQQGLLAKKGKQQVQTAENSWFNYFKAGFLLIVGTIMLTFLEEPTVETINDFSTAVSVPSFVISYVVIPVAMTYRAAMAAIKSARLKTKRAISLTFSEICNGVFMNNVMGLSVFLVLVYVRDLSWDVSAEALVVLIICTLMGVVTSSSTKFPLWTAIIAYLMYPISLGLLYLLTQVFGWS